MSEVHDTLGRDIGGGILQGAAGRSGYYLALRVCRMHVTACTIDGCTVCADWRRKKGFPV